MGQSFFVYHNWRRDRVRLHEAACRYCNAGAGTRSLTSRRDDEWLGPFPREEAVAAARRLRCDDFALCATCRP